MVWLPATLAILTDEQVEDWLDAYFTHFRVIIHTDFPDWEAEPFITLLWGENMGLGDMDDFTAKESSAIIANWLKECW